MKFKSTLVVLTLLLSSIVAPAQANKFGNGLTTNPPPNTYFLGHVNTGQSSYFTLSVTPNSNKPVTIGTIDIASNDASMTFAADKQSGVTLKKGDYLNVIVKCAPTAETVAAEYGPEHVVVIELFLSTGKLEWFVDCVSD
jgi:hypothetical protein